MLFHMVTRETGSKYYAKRGTMHAKTAARAVIELRRYYRIASTTQVVASSKGYPSNFLYDPLPTPLTPKRDRRQGNYVPLPIKK